jgi:translation initiation factor IF-2
MDKKKKLEIVLKCDSVGSQEAVLVSLASVENPEAELKVIQAGVGSISKSDLFMALTGSRLVMGFNVDIMPHIQEMSKEQGIEIRVYAVISALAHDLNRILKSWITPHSEERITGSAKVIALFKSSRKGIILGCEVLKGTLSLGKNFRVISAMGPVYQGKIESLYIERDAVKEAKVGHQVGLKISGFKNAKVGDLIECYETAKPKQSRVWHPKGGVFYFKGPPR